MGSWQQVPCKHRANLGKDGVSLAAAPRGLVTLPPSPGLAPSALLRAGTRWRISRADLQRQLRRLSEVRIPMGTARWRGLRWGTGWERQGRSPGEKVGQGAEEKHGAREERRSGRTEAGRRGVETAQLMVAENSPDYRRAFSHGLCSRAGLPKLVATSPEWHFKLKLKLIIMNYN